MPSWSTRADAGDERLGLTVDAHLALDASQLDLLAAQGRREDAWFGFVVHVLHGFSLLRCGY